MKRRKGAMRPELIDTAIITIMTEYEFSVETILTNMTELRNLLLDVPRSPLGPEETLNDYFLVLDTWVRVNRAKLE